MPRMKDRRTAAPTSRHPEATTAPRRATAATLLLPVLFALTACAEAPAPSDPAQGETAALLPAYETPREARAAAKGDEQSDWRLAHPEWYAVTVPPSAPVRAMVEWEPMTMLLAAWPNYLATDKGARETVVDMLGSAVSTAHTDVGVVVESNAGAQKALSSLLAWGLTEEEIATRVHLWQMPLDSVWFIDFGPLPVVDQGLQRVGLVDFRYFKGRSLDDAIPSRLTLGGGLDGGPALPLTAWRAPFNFEGGNFQADGEGGCYTSERALKNTGATQAEVAAILKDYVGCTRLVVLQDLTDDATGHIDMFFKLARRDRAVVGTFDGTIVADVANQARLDHDAELLAGTPLPDGAPMTVLRMPFPTKKGTVPRTFLNSTLVNGVNLWPVYKDDGAAGALEAQAEAIWEQALPGWKNVAIISDRLADLSGAIHCISRTLPALELAPIVPPGACVDGACAGEADAFAGVCQTDAACTGPAWACACPVCNASCGPPPCGDVPAGGACAGRARLACVAGFVDTETCPGCCAVDPATGSASCAASCDACDGCEEGQVGCEGDHAWRCEVTDGCARRIYTSCDGGGCTAGACHGCAGIAKVGCCADGNKALSCSVDGVVEASCGPGWSCGWDGLGGFYACVPDDRLLLDDPSSEHPISCPGACVDACAMGSGGCLPDGSAVWGCTDGPDGCRVRADTPCLPGRTCVDGTCVAGPPGGSDAGGGGDADAEREETGASGCTGGGGPAGLLAALLVALATTRRRRRAP